MWMVTRSPPGSSNGRACVGVDELLEAEVPQHPLQLVRRVPGEQHRGRPVDVVGEEGQVEVVAVEVGDVQVVRVLDGGPHVVRELVVAGEHEPRAEERGDEPRVAHDRARARSRSGSRRGRATWRA